MTLIIFSRWNIFARCLRRHLPSMQIISPNGEKMYNLTAGKTLPEWLAEAKKRSLKKNHEFRSRITLIQDLFFSTSCQKIRYSRDGQFLFATGLYPPQTKVYELSELTVKYDRRLDAPVVELEVLSDDYSKVVYLRNDRYIEFHSRHGVYYKTRIPSFGRDMAYDYSNCDLLTVGASSEIYRLNLERGSFLKPYTSTCRGLNVCHINPFHGLYGFGSEDGIVEFWDHRDPTEKPIGFLDVGKHAQELSKGFVTHQPEVTALTFHSNGLTVGVGTSTGQCLLYDLRTSAALSMKDHQYGTRIVDFLFHKTSNNVVTACKKITKIWDYNSGDLFCSLEPPGEINSVCLQENSGILFMACEEPKIHTYYIPGIGPAPKWCSFLDNVANELEEASDTVIYQDYRFITKQDLEQLGVEKMIGTPYLRAYSNGFFIDTRLYDKVRALARPNEFDEFRKAKIQENIEKKRESRITLAKKLPAVNKQLALRLMSKTTNESKAEALLSDRFGSLFTNPAFAIDENSDAFKIINPMGKKNIEEQLEEVEESEESEEDMDDSEASDHDRPEEDSDDKQVSFLAEERYKKAKRQESKTEAIEPATKKRKIQLFESKNNINPLDPESQKLTQKARVDGVSFGKRIEAHKSYGERESIGDIGGSLQMTFTPQEVKDQAKKQRREMIEKKQKNKERRSMARHLPRDDNSRGRGRGGRGGSSRGGSRGRGRGGGKSRGDSDGF